MKNYSKYGKGWYNESDRHRLARLGVKTGRKSYSKFLVPPPKGSEVLFGVGTKPYDKLHKKVVIGEWVRMLDMDKKGRVINIDENTVTIRMRDGSVHTVDKSEIDYAKEGWMRGSNMSIYVGQHQSQWIKPSGKFIYGKRNGEKVKQPVSYVVTIDGEKGTSSESGKYYVSWFKGFTSEPSRLFHPAISPAYNVNIIGKQYQLKRAFYGRLTDVNKVRDVISKMIDKTGKLPSSKEIRNKIIRLKDDSYTISNWVSEERGK